MATHYGLVCITRSDELRFRTVTRTRYLALTPEERRLKLEDLYRHNLEVLFRALDFCRARGIRLYRATANLFPLSDWEDGVGQEVLDGLRERLQVFGARARSLDVRVVVHPDQFVVLNSERPQVVENSVGMLLHQASIFDRLGLERSPWAAINLHGGKGGRAEALVRAIGALPEAARSRLTLENDERAFGADAILEVCREAGVPMVFDPHHHVVKEKLAGFGDPSVRRFTELARSTWEPPDWQIVHLSNGREGPQDSRHSDFVESVPEAFRDVTWIEVEAKAKEEAVARLAAGS